MKYCRTCKISYNTPLNDCLFCNNALEKVNATKEMNYYPPVAKRSRIARFLLKLLAFLFLLANVSCLYIDYISDKETKLSWSLFVLSSSVYAFLLLISILKSSTAIQKLYWIFLLTIIEMLAIGIVSGSYHWATDFVLPFGILLFTITMTSFLFGKNTKLFDYTIYIILSSGLFFIPLLLLVFDITKTNWPTIVCTVYCIITFMTLIYFRPKQVKF